MPVKQLQCNLPALRREHPPDKQVRIDFICGPQVSEPTFTPEKPQPE
jgi:hypothetical protein